MESNRTTVTFTATPHAIPVRIGTGWNPCVRTQLNDNEPEFWEYHLPYPTYDEALSFAKDAAEHEMRKFQASVDNFNRAVSELLSKGNFLS